MSDLDVIADHELLQRWRAGDTVAGNTLVRRHFDALYCFFRSKLDEDVSDMVQRSLLACVQARDRVPERAGFRAYLFGIARNQLLMHLRRAGRRRRVITPLLESGRAVDPSPSGVVLIRQEQRLLLCALRSLPLAQQIAVELFYWEQLSVREISVVLHLSETATKSCLHHARGKLRQQLERATGPGDAIGSDLDHWVRSMKRRAFERRSDTN